MRFAELFFLAVGLSMDAFAAAVCSGLAMAKTGAKKCLIVGLYFGIFQAVMPVVGYAAALLFAERIISYDHWVAFALLCFLGFKMIAGSLKKECRPEGECPAESRVPDGKRPAEARVPDGERPAESRVPDAEPPTDDGSPTRPARMLSLALATSIDALAVGVSFAFLKVSLAPAALFIGLVTFAVSAAGVKIGNVFGAGFRSRAEMAGGAVLILIGLKILLGHLNIINF